MIYTLKQPDISLYYTREVIMLSIISIFSVMLDFAVKLFTLGALILAIKALKIYIGKHE